MFSEFGLVRPRRKATVIFVRSLSLLLLVGVPTAVDEAEESVATDGASSSL